MGLFTSFKKSRLENKFKKKEWVIIQPIPFAQFEQLIIDHVDSGWEIEDDYERLAENTSNWQCELRKGTSILTCIGQLTTKVLYMGLNGCLQDYLKS